mmetsp:Transcript_16408/g.35528  ORF Transcript_16408/g.35528 Transcript_16408/m.35528 type:complete len:92 (+) Transcript_16408:658-933(+)
MPYENVSTASTTYWSIEEYSANTEACKRPRKTKKNNFCEVLLQRSEKSSCPSELHQLIVIESLQIVASLGESPSTTHEWNCTILSLLLDEE